MTSNTAIHLVEKHLIPQAATGPSHEAASGRFAVLLGAMLAGLTLFAAPAQAVSIWPTATPEEPTLPFDAGDTSAYEFGVRFKSTVNGTVTGIRFYKVTANVGPHYGSLWSNAVTRLAVTNFVGETPSGWQQQNFAAPVPITAGTVYVASYSCPSGGYSADLASDPGSLSAGVTNLPLIAVPNSEGGNGVLAVGTNNFPASSANGLNWWVDVVFAPATDTNPPTVLSVSPTAGAVNVQPNVPVTVTFNEAMLASTITTNTITLTNITTGTRVAATLSYSAANATATLQPLLPLTLGHAYSGRVRSGASGVKDTTTNALVSDFAWSFTVTTSPSVSIFDPATTPPVAVDNAALTLGVKFQSTEAGFIKGIRFYKGEANTGSHTGTLWSVTGTKLAEAAFVGETASGWQEQLFATPVAIQSNTTYVASYWAPNGNYAFTGAFFDGQGATNSPLIALPNGVDGGNGVFDAVALSNSFPTSSFNAANYWVDVVYVTTLGPDTNAPTVISTLPASGATGVGLTLPVQATFSEPMQASTITTNTFQLRNAVNTLIPATVSYNSGSQSAVLQPLGALGVNQTYTARVISGVNGVKDTATNALATDFVWNFTTTANVGTNIFGNDIPGTESSSDPAPLELGVRFKSAAAGFIRGIRFYKGTNNTGEHIGNLWAADGTPLGTVTFSGETATGWQQQLFTTPIAITSNTTYIASYFAPNGGYAFDSLFFDGKGVTNFPLRALSSQEAVSESAPGNGVFNNSGVSAFPNQTFNAANYWVDVLYTDQNTAPTAGVVNRTLPEDTSTNLTLIGSDAEGAVTFSLVSNPAHGIVSNFDTNAGTLTYTPFTNYFGADTFNYRVSDGSLFATGTVNLTITGVDDPAIANNQNFSLPQNTPTNLVLTAIDPDGAGAANEFLTVTATASPDNWTASSGTKVAAVTGADGAYIDSSSSSGTQQQFALSDAKFIQPGDPISSVTLRSTCRRGASGSSSYRVSTVLGGSVANAGSQGVGNSFGDYTDTFSSRPGGGAWTIADVQNLQIRIENTSRTIDCTYFDAYVTFQGYTNRSYTILSGPAHGTITLLNTNNGTLTYTPTPGYNGPDSFTFRVSSSGLLSTGLVSIAVGTSNAAPPVVANPIGTQNATYGTAYSFTFATNVFTDPDSPVLTYSATGMPPGIGFTGGTRTFAGTPTASGNYPVALVAADNTVPALKATNTFNLDVAKAGLSVTASNRSKPYGVPVSFVGNEFFTAGLKLSDTATSATLASAGAPVSAAAGPYPITITNVTGLGLSNYTISYVSGTLTVQPPVPFSITSIGVTNNIATLTWQSISGRVYRLEYKDTLTAPSWTEVPADIISTGTSTTTNNNTGGATNRFYRVK